MNDLDDMEAFIDRLTPATQRALTIIKKDELKDTPLLHISPNNSIRNFVPVIGHRQMKTEDRTVPRVCTAPTILGCMMGATNVTTNFFNGFSDQEGKPSPSDYKGGYTIYGFDDIELALRPGKSLVGDRDVSDEHWLVAYNADTAKIIPKIHGKFFYTSVIYDAKGKDGPAATVTLLIEVTREGGLAFSKNHRLAPGYWMIIGPDSMRQKSWKHDSDFVVTQIDKGYFVQKKKVCADLLSHAPNPNAPIFAKW
jgi:hypothetical protein